MERLNDLAQPSSRAGEPAVLRAVGYVITGTEPLRARAQPPLSTFSTYLPLPMLGAGLGRASRERADRFCVLAGKGQRSKSKRVKENPLYLSSIEAAHCYFFHIAQGLQTSDGRATVKNPDLKRADT